MLLPISLVACAYVEDPREVVPAARRKPRAGRVPGHRQDAAAVLELLDLLAAARVENPRVDAAGRQEGTRSVPSDGGDPKAVLDLG